MVYIIYPGHFEPSAANPSRETKYSGSCGEREIIIFPDQLTTSRMSNLTRLIHTYCNDTTAILPGIGLVVIRTIRPKGKNEVSEGLEIQFPFPCGAEDAVPVCLI